ncbi:hypothetical protein INR49_025386 [Caranx melampygus]|nr:hypothetical protein INR49_025386 [Caranx melampygus]
MNVWLSLSLLTGFFLCSTMCTVVLKRIKNRIFPPVPKPVIPELTDFQPENQEAILERKEEVNDLTLLQPPSPKGKSVPEDVGEITVLQREWDDGSDEDVENEMTNLRMSGGSSDDRPGSTEQVLRSSREEEITDLEQVDNEIAMLIYRNGLVFDVKTDST